MEEGPSDPPEGAGGSQRQTGPAPDQAMSSGETPGAAPCPAEASDPMDVPGGGHPASSAPSTPTEAEPPDPFDRERLFDLLFRSQSRRLNEQRCALPRMRGAARPWHSLPATPTTATLGTAGFFCSLTSLQAEEFFEFVAMAQARRLDDQRADFVEPVPDATGPGAAAVGPRADAVGPRADAVGPRAPQGSQGPLDSPDLGEELYSTILSLQSQRLEEQRSDPPIPLGAEELFDLLLRVQGGRMDEQRSELPSALLPHPC